jgi:hypothetical protein
MADIDSITATNSINWDTSIEKMLTKWCDEAKCFEWMHTEAFGYYDTRGRLIAIISNILIASTGLSNIIIGDESVNGFKLSWVFGSLSIIITIVNMLQEKLSYLVKATKHSRFAIQWGNIRRKIEEIISIPPESRKDCKTFLKYIRQDINHVSIDGNTMIPVNIRDRCAAKFSVIANFDIPDICGKMEHTQSYTKAESLHTSLIIKDSNKDSLYKSPIKKYREPTPEIIVSTP